MNNPNSASLILTESCNLSCSYCYEKGCHDNKFMSLDVAKKAVDFLISNAKQDGDNHISINFFGGEPLINFEVLKDTFYYAKKRCQEENLSFKGSIVTNGTLFPEGYDKFLIDYLSFGNTIIQISLDGSKEAHDKNRVYLNGEGSYDDIIKNIEKYKNVIKENKLDFNKLSVHMVMNKETLPYLYDGYKTIIDLGFKGAWHLIVQEEKWDENDEKIYLEQLNKISNLIKEKVIETKDNTYLFANPVLSNCPVKIAEKPCSSGVKYCSINYEGNIYPCHDFYFNFKDSEEFLLGNLEEGINDDKRFIFLNYDSDSMFAEKFCGSCENTQCYRCIARNYKNNGSILLGFPNYCRMVSIEHKVKYNLLEELEKEGINNLPKSVKPNQEIPNLMYGENNYDINLRNQENQHKCNCEKDENLLLNKINELERKIDIMFDLFSQFFYIYMSVIKKRGDFDD